MKVTAVFFIIHLFPSFCVYGFTNVHKLYQLIENHREKDKIYLLSYPRSGNTWIRYCIEFLTQHPTLSYLNNINNLSNLPIGLSAGFFVDESKDFIWKVHNSDEMNFFKEYDSEKEFLIFIVRNPKEVLIRDAGDLLLQKGLEQIMHIPLRSGYYFSSYFANLDIYDQWNPANKILIYYEDLILQPEKVLSEILLFLNNESDDKLNSFLKDIERHISIALNVYKYNGISESQGSDVLYHSRALPLRFRVLIENTMRKIDLEIWNKYLKDRYSEEILLESGAYNFIEKN